MWFEPCPASSLPEQEQLLIIPLRWTLQGLACTTREASTVSIGAEPHCTLTWLWDHLVWSTFAAIHMSNMQVQAHPWSGNIVRAGWAPRIWMCKDGWFLTAPGRAAIVTGNPWGCICRGGRSCGASFCSRGRTLSCIVVNRELLSPLSAFMGNLLYASPGIWSAVTLRRCFDSAYLQKQTNKKPQWVILFTNELVCLLKNKKKKSRQFAAFSELSFLRCFIYICLIGLNSEHQPGCDHY